MSVSPLPVAGDGRDAARSGAADCDPRVAIVHDYLTQRGGAERVVLAMASCFGGAPIYTSLYDRDGTFPAFGRHTIHASLLNRVPAFRAHHRLALPLLAPTFSHLRVDADVALCSSSGWAHGVRCDRRKIVYCYTPARWLYQTERYVGVRHFAAKQVVRALRPALTRWDRRAAATADRYVVLSSVVQDRVRELYGIDADIVPPPHSVDVDGPVSAVAGVDAGAVLCVARLLPYKNVSQVIDAFRSLPDRQLVVVGAGPIEAELRRAAPRNVRLTGAVSDAELRWLYANSSALVAASHEDFGLTPIEAAAFGKPSAVLRWGGFLDTTIEGVTGVFFDEATPDCIAAAVRQLDAEPWSRKKLQAHAAQYSEAQFHTRLRRVVTEVCNDR